MLNRRTVLAAPAAFAAAHALTPSAPVDAERVREALAAVVARSPDDLARDNDFWASIARAFDVDRSLVNFNNGGVSPTVATSLTAMKRHLDHTNTAPSKVLWTTLRPQREAVRQQLAHALGTSPDEVAFTRNASESLQTVQFGVDLARGDEVLANDQDYPRMINSFRQRERREGVVLKTIAIPTPCEDDDEVVRRYEAAITPRTRLILVSHVINLTGQVLPVTKIAALGRRRGVPVLVDGAHAFAHIPTPIDEIGADFYAASLHKWLFAPIGTGFLHVRRERIAEVWPMMAAHEGIESDIRKFEQIGTHPLAPLLAIAEALTFHETLGAERKLARLVHLRDSWARRLLENDRVRLHTSLKPGFSGGIATFEIEGVDTRDLYGWLWNERRILTSPVVRDDFSGLRVSPSVYTTMGEIERFCSSVEHVLEHGLPT